MIVMTANRNKTPIKIQTIKNKNLAKFNCNRLMFCYKERPMINPWRFVHMPQNSFVKTPFGLAVKSEKVKSDRLKGKVIVQILPALNNGGVERGTVEMAEAIIRAGGRAVVISSGGVLVSKLQRIGAEHVTLNVASKNPLKWMFVRRQVKDVLKSVGADLVHIRSRAPAWIALAAAKALGLKTVTTIHGRFKASTIFKRLYNGIMTKSDRIIAISHYIEDLTLKQFPKVRDKISVIHRGVDVDLFNPQGVSAQRVINIAEQLNLPDGVPVVILPARPTAWKGASILIAAMSKLIHLDYVLVLMGAGDGSDDYIKTLMNQTEQVGIAEKCRISPSVSDMPAALMLSDVVVMPSITPEPFGRVAIEGSAMGCPVVAFDHGGASESIIHGETGWLAKPSDADDLADGIAQALGLTQKQRQKLANDAQNFVEKNFTSEKMCQSTISIYVDLLKS